MGPIELLYFAIGIIVALVGLARGYVKELGTTLIILVSIFILTFFQTQLSGIMVLVGERIFGATDQPSQDLVLSSFYSLFFAAIVFASYSGGTLTFSGQPAPPPQGTLISVVIGTLNGYLVAGTLWYYQHAFSYPIGQLVTFTNDLTENAQRMVEYLPPALFDSPVYWVVPVAFLLIIRVRG
jgi:hypothetical protein